MYERISWLSLLTASALALNPACAMGQVYDTSMFRALQWRNIATNRAGRVTTAVGLPGNPRVYYMGATGGGVWKTEDAGGSWRNISDGFMNTGSIGDIAVFDGNPSIIYVGTGEAPVRGQMSSSGDGVYKSIDAGVTWTRSGLNKTRQIGRVVVHPSDANIVYVAALGSRWGPSDERGVYRTTDGGTTWKRILFVSPNAGASEVVMDPTNPRLLYATLWDFQRTPWSIRSGGSGSGIWKSSDGGDTWAPLTNGLPAIMGRIGIAIAPAMPRRVYAVVEADSGGMYRSDDSGASWRRVSGTRMLQVRPWYFSTVTVDPKNADVVFAPVFSMLRSSDGGITYAERPSPHSDNHRLWINPLNGQNMILPTDGGVVVSFDAGESWSSVENQPTGQFYAVQTDDLFPYNLYGGQQDGPSLRMPSRVLGATSGARATTSNWMPLAGGETARFAFDPKRPEIVFSTGFLGELHRYDMTTGMQRSVTEFPGGQHLGSASIELPYRFNWSAPLTWSPFDAKVMYHGANVVFRSVNGYDWTPISPDLTRNDKNHEGRSGPFWHDGSGGEIYNTIVHIVESPRERGTIWVGTDDGLVQLTRDNGRTWRNVTPAQWGEGLVYSIEVGPHANGTAYIAFSRRKWDDDTPHFFLTRDYGTTWTDLATSLPRDQPARVIREDPVRKGLLFAGTEHGLWISFDGGRAWQSFQHGVPIVPISDMQVHHDDLIVATEGRAFWVLDDMTPLRQLRPAVASAPLFLFKPKTATRINGSARSGGVLGAAVIRYSLRGTLAATDTLQLDILDAAGVVVRRTTQLGSVRGLNQFVWDLRGRQTPTERVHGMPTGQYSVRMSLGRTTVSQSLTVVPDPRAGSTPSAEREHASMVATLSTMSTDLDRAIADLRDARTHARALAARALNAPVVPRDQAIQSLIVRVDSLEAAVVTGGANGDPIALDVLHVSPKLNTDIAGMLASVEGISGPVTSGEREQLARLRQRASAFQVATARALTTDMDQVNALVAGSGLQKPAFRTGKSLPQDPRATLRAGWLDAGQAIWNMDLVSSTARPAGFFNAANINDLAVINSDLAFSRNFIVQGNFHGFQIWDATNPKSLRLRTAFVCPGGQMDPSIHGNLLFFAAEMPNGRIDCGTQGVRDSVSKERFKGVRIFDISDLDHPKQIAVVQTCRGAHTQTLVVDPNDKANVYIYASGTFAVRSPNELAGCSGASADKDSSTSLFRIDVIKVPLAAPQDAQVISSPRIFADSGRIAGLWMGGNHGEGTQTTQITDQCHDITVYSAIGLAAGACSGNGILIDIRKPSAPQRIAAVSDANFAYWHSATFNNDGTTVVFTDEWGGGQAARCRATDKPEWGANAIYKLSGHTLTPASYYKLPVVQTAEENCVAHNGSLVPVPGRDIMVQAWYQGGVSVVDFTDAAHPREIAYFDRGPMDSTKLMSFAGSWGAYWHNGYIVSSEIARGIDMLSLTPSEYLSQHEIDAARLVRDDVFNPQTQQRIVWPAAYPVARAYLDQLTRNDGLPALRREAISRELDRTEPLRRTQRRAPLERLAAQIVRDADSARDAARVRALAAVVKALANAKS